MEFVGGYLALVELEKDARAYDDVLLVMRAQAEAQKRRTRKRA